MRNTGRKSLYLAAASVALMVGIRSAGADSINGFGDGSALTLTGYTQDGTGAIINTNAPTVSAGALTLTTAGEGEAGAAFFNTAQSVSHFSIQFDYVNDPSGEPPLGASDGFALVFQNESLSAIGGGGAGLGYGLQNNNQPPGGPSLMPIFSSAALEFFLRTTPTGLAYETGGNIDPTSGVGNVLTSLVDMSSGDPIHVSVTYDGTTLTEQLTDIVSNAQFSTSFAADLATAVGGPSAFIGFTGGTGGGFSQQTLSGFTFTTDVAATPLPAGALGGVALLGAFGIGQLRRRHPKLA